MGLQKSFLIVGGGLVGLATSYRLLERFPSAKVKLLEKESDVGMHQSTHNSGVLHAGLYYSPNSAKAKLAVSGIKQMINFCQTENIPHEICGKLVVAVTSEELPRLDELLRRGTANGLKGLKKLEKNDARKIEPHVNALSAISVPEEGIVDYRKVCDRLAEIIKERGGQIFTDAKVVKLEHKVDQWLAVTTNSEFSSSYLINCAGLHCDRVAELAGEQRDIRIIPFRGEYFQLKPSAQHLVKNLVYPVPNPEFPFLGVHFTRMINGGVEAGPNAVLAFAREGYHLAKFDINDMFDVVSFAGFWRFLSRYPSMALSEFGQSLSKSLFCKALQRLVPEIQSEDIVPGHSGVRAQAMNFSGELVNDFHLLIRNNAIHVLNAPSPAATACLAIGQHIVDQLPN